MCIQNSCIPEQWVILQRCNQERHFYCTPSVTFQEPHEDHATLHSWRFCSVRTSVGAAKARLASGRIALRWRHNDHAGVSNHQPHGCLLNRLFRRKSKKTSKLRVTGLCAGNSPGTGEFPAQMASYAENVSIWWRNHGGLILLEMFAKYLMMCAWNHRVPWSQTWDY